MPTLHSVPAHLEALVAHATGQPIGFYLAVGVAIFLCYMVACEFDAMFSR